MVKESTGKESPSGSVGQRLSLLREHLERARDELGNACDVSRRWRAIREPDRARRRGRADARAGRRDCFHAAGRDLAARHRGRPGQFDTGRYGLSEVSGEPIGFRLPQGHPLGPRHGRRRRRILARILALPVRPRQAHDEGGTQPELRLHRQCPAARLDDPIDDRQPEAGSRVGPAFAAIGRTVRTPFLRPRRHPQAVVGDAQIVPAVDRASRDLHLGGGVGTVVLDGVLRQVRQRLPQQPLAAGDRRVIDGDAQLALFALEARREILLDRAATAAGSQEPRTCPSTRASVKASSTSVSIRCTPRSRSLVAWDSWGTLAVSREAARWRIVSGPRMSWATRPANASRSRFRSSRTFALCAVCSSRRATRRATRDPHHHGSRQGQQAGAEQRDHQPEPDRGDHRQTPGGARVVHRDEAVEVLAHAGELAGRPLHHPPGLGVEVLSRQGDDAGNRTLQVLQVLARLVPGGPLAREGDPRLVGPHGGGDLRLDDRAPRFEALLSPGSEATMCSLTRICFVFTSLAKLLPPGGRWSTCSPRCRAPSPRAHGSVPWRRP